MAPPGALVIGIVLAAGESRRMGRPKALLPCGQSGETFVARCIRVLIEGGAREVLVVGRPNDVPLRAEVLRLQAAAFVENPAAASGQLSSLLIGLQHADARQADAVAVLPVDTPQVRPATVAALIAAAAARPIVRATFEGRHGHPVLFRREVFEELRRADPARGARAVLHAEPARVLDLEVDDPGVIRDFDYPDDYAACFNASP